MINGFKVITLCGSTKFKDEFLAEQKRLTLEGNIVISVGMFGHSGDTEVWQGDTKQKLDSMHFAKIDMADAIHVINKHDYIGISTANEINYAISKGKEITYYEPHDYMFRVLNDEEVIDFKRWARENYIVGAKIPSTWHPVVRMECLEMQKCYDANKFNYYRNELNLVFTENANIKVKFINDKIVTKWLAINPESIIEICDVLSKYLDELHLKQ